MKSLRSGKPNTHFEQIPVKAAKKIAANASVNPEDSRNSNRGRASTSMKTTPHGRHMLPGKAR